MQPGLGQLNQIIPTYLIKILNRLIQSSNVSMIQSGEIFILYIVLCRSIPSSEVMKFSG